MIAIVDYGAGNLFSVKNALDSLGAASAVTSDENEILQASGVILPGVGAFPLAMQMLTQSALVPAVRTAAAEKPFLGICLGMQMLLEWGFEFQKCEGLGILPGRAEPISAPGLKIPHMGWNSLSLKSECPLFYGIEQGEYVYFVHSYHAVVPDRIEAASTEYGGRITAALWDGNRLFATQFHPEKSGRTGLSMLRNFAAVCGK